MVFVHESGHFLAARALGIDVEVFALGWGKTIWRKRGVKTEYRIGMLPIGGYCKMKGEELFRKALEEKADSIETEKGSLYSAGPLKRLICYAAGPMANLLFAVVVLSVLWYAGFTINTFSNKIVLLSDYPAIFSPGEQPANRAGLETGDTIISIGGESIKSYADIQEAVAPRAGTSTKIEYIRNGQTFSGEITPQLDTSRGIGKIGISAWIEPEISSVSENSPAALAGIQAGDRILSAGEGTIEHYLDLYALLDSSPGKIRLELDRDGERIKTTLIPSYGEKGEPILGISFSGITIHSEKVSPAGALAKGADEAISTFFLTIKGLGSLFSGVKVQDAVSGPIRITYMVGEIAGQGFAQSFATGLTNLFRFISLISVALCFGNLLPIPALDGGLIIISLLEFFRGKQIRPKTLYRYQTIGFFIILLILIFTTFGDISFLLKE